VLIAGWLGPAPAVYAQAEPLEAGREARLYVRGVAMVLEGTLTSVSSDALQIGLRDGSSFTVSPSQLERADVLASRRNTVKGTVVGLGIGLAVGVALVVTASGAERGIAVSGDAAFGDELEAWELIVPSVAGASVGAFVGYSIRTMRWAPAVVPGGAGTPGDFTLAWTVVVR
jgi:hypothetical protein